MNEALKEKLKGLPNSPGVYFHKNTDGEIIYVGKAANLKNRVRQYFQSRKDMDPKTLALVDDIYDTDWIEVETEMDALFLEAEMIKRYMPRWNILLRDDKSHSYIRINMGDEVPYVSLTRNPLDDGATYHGPYYGALPIKKALRYLRRIFPYYTKPYDGKMNLDTHLGLTPGVELGKSAKGYKENLRKMVRYIKGERSAIIRELDKEMKMLSELQQFEKAAEVRNQYLNLKELQRRVVFGDKEFLDISKDQALVGLKNLLGLAEVPKRIEGYDISHMSGVNVVSSMVVFKNGVADRSEYRKFKIKVDRNDDYANMRETIERRLGHLKDWGRPDLVLIDGGKGQISAVADLLLAENIPFIGRDKSGEHGGNADFKIIAPIYKDSPWNGGDEDYKDCPCKELDITKDSHVGKLLVRIDEESHRFAVSYHTLLRQKAQTKSALDEIPGVGPKTKAVLKKKVGSVAKIREMSEVELGRVVGVARAKIIKRQLG